jgi:hypothetical protein
MKAVAMKKGAVVKAAPKKKDDSAAAKKLDAASKLTGKAKQRARFAQMLKSFKK